MSWINFGGQNSSLGIPTKFFRAVLRKPTKFFRREICPLQNLLAVKIFLPPVLVRFIYDLNAVFDSLRWSPEGVLEDSEGVPIRNVWKTWSWSTVVNEMETAQSSPERTHGYFCHFC